MELRSDRQKGLSYSELGRKYNIDRRTAKKYAESDSKPVYNLTDSKPSKLDPYKDQIVFWLEEAPYSAMRIWEKVREQGFDGGYTVVKQFVRGKKEQLNEQATVRFETIPGQQGQVISTFASRKPPAASAILRGANWAFFENYKVREDGVEKKLYCFLMILGYSRMRYIEFVTDMSTDTLIRCHINAFRYFNGYPEEMLYDNMKQVVIKRLMKQEESTFNRQFEDFAGFYGFKPVLCRPYRGQTKGKIERTVRYVRENLMVGINYDSLDDLNGQALAWCNKVNGREHGATGKIPFEQLPKENLNPLIREYIIDKINLRRVGKDCLISYDNKNYSVPPEYVGKDVAVVALGNLLAAYHEGKQVAVHRISYIKKDMVALRFASQLVNPIHYQKMTVKQSFDIENTLLIDGDVIDKPVQVHDLSIYDEVAL